MSLGWWMRGRWGGQPGPDSMGHTSRLRCWTWTRVSEEPDRLEAGGAWMEPSEQSAPDSVPAPRGPLLWPRGARHAPELLSEPSTHAKSINNPAAKPHCSFLTWARLTSPEWLAWEFTQLSNQWLWFTHHLDCDPAVSQATASNYRIKCMNGFFD